MTNGSGGGDPVENFVKNLKHEVTAAGNVTLRPMLSLRSGFRYARLGPKVTELMSKKLAGEGLGHAPAELPLGQDDKVLIFTLGSEVAEVVRAVLDPSEGSEQVLRRVTSGTASEVLAQIRALVCE